MERGWHKVRGWWVLWTFVPFAAPIGFVYAARRARSWAFGLAAALYVLGTAAGAVINSLDEARGSDNDVTGAYFLILWVLTPAVALAMRRDYVRRVELVEHPAIEAARVGESSRALALRLAREAPELAREAGVGRPDRRGSFDGRVVDVNSAPVEAIGALPGIGEGLARMIVDAREQIDGFSSLEDMGMALDLPGDLVEDLRRHVVFLPR